MIFQTNLVVTEISLVIIQIMDFQMWEITFFLLQAVGPRP